MAFIHRHKTPELWIPGLTPPASSMLSVNWSHPLSRGLVSYVLPAHTQIDLAGGPSFSNETGIRGIGPLGIEYSGSRDTGLSALTSAQRITTSGSLFWFGRVNGALGSYANIFGSAWSNPVTPPYNCFQMGTHLSGATLRLGWNNNGTQGDTQDLSGIGIAFSRSLALTFDGVNCLFYRNGSYGSTVATAISIGYTATSYLIVGTPTNLSTTVAAMWNRTLSNDEIAQLDRDPFTILVPNRRPLRNSRLLQAYQKSIQFVIS